MRVAHFQRTAACPDNTLVGVPGADVDLSQDRVEVEGDAAALFEEALHGAAYAAQSDADREAGVVPPAWFEREPEAPVAPEPEPEPEPNVVADVSAPDEDDV